MPGLRYLTKITVWIGKTVATFELLWLMDKYDNAMCNLIRILTLSRSFPLLLTRCLLLPPIDFSIFFISIFYFLSTRSYLLLHSPSLAFRVFTWAFLFRCPSRNWANSPNLSKFPVHLTKPLRLSVTMDSILIRASTTGSFSWISPSTSGNYPDTSSLIPRTF